MITKLPWGKKLRTSAANNLEKINEVIDAVNNIDVDIEMSKSINLKTGEQGTNILKDATSFESIVINGKYVQNGTPSIETPVPIQTITGSDLFDPSKAVNNSWVAQSGTDSGTIQPNSSHCRSDFIPVEPNTTYYVRSLTVVKSFKSDKTFFRTIRYTSSSGRFTTTDGDAYVVLQNYNSLPSISYQNNAINDCHLSVATYYGNDPLFGKIDLAFRNPFMTDLHIDLKGLYLASLPDGTHDELIINTFGHVVIKNNIARIESYNGESVGNNYISSTGELSTGAEVYYKINSPIITDLGLIELPNLSSNIFEIFTNINSTFNVVYWVFGEITSIINDVKDYVDYKILNQSNESEGN